jgi:hypothetical protein
MQLWQAEKVSGVKQQGHFTLCSSKQQQQQEEQQQHASKYWKGALTIARGACVGR